MATYIILSRFSPEASEDPRDFMFGGNLPKDRASLITSEVLEMMPREIVLTLPGA